ncbi:MAG: tyrosine-type recombinase/integrase [Anaerolineae bacterium]|nr:tyrosine-type recombinase/integrase [Anaerolineae bacterium]
MLLSACVKKYLDDCYALSTRTQELYTWHLDRLLQTVGDLPVDALTVDVLRSFMAGQRRQDGHPYSPAFLDQVYRTLHTFFEWCVRESLRRTNPLVRVRRPRVPKRKSPRLSLGEIGQLLDAVSDSPRDLAMILLMLDSGLRKGEVLGLTLGGVDLERGTAKVFGKDREEREVPLGPMTCAALEAYLANRPPAQSQQLFLSKRGNRPLTDDGLGTFMRRLKERAGLERLHCHLLRHTFSNHYIDNGGGLRQLQKILGHSSVETTARLYTDPELGRLQEEHSRVSPLAALSLVIEKNVSFPS